ncbi:hypothetical protein D4Q76_02405, partial [archaeon]
SKGKRFINDGYVYLELVEAPTINIINTVNETQLVPIKEDINTIGYFYIGNSKNDNELDYSEEVLPFIIANMKNRIKKDYFNIFSPPANALNFFLLFEPMKYILKVRNNDTHVKKSLYLLASNFGIIELSLEENKIIEMEQKNSISELNIRDISKSDVDVTTFYISAIKSENPFYQFLNLYHIVESYSYDFFAEYFKENISDARKIIQELRDAKGEDEHLIKRSFLQLSNSDNIIAFTKQELDKIRVRLNKLIQEINKNISGGDLANYENWGENNIYIEKFARFIYKLRAEVAHKKVRGRMLEKYALEYIDVIKVVNKIMFRIGECVINKKVIG